MAEDSDPGLFAIQLSSDDENDNHDGNGSSSKKTPRLPRDAQSEEQFQSVKKDYRVKIENGELWKSIQLPLNEVVTKPEAQALLHAVEELYFLRRYGEGAQLVQRVLGSDDGTGQVSSPPANGLDEDTRKLLRYYESKCAERSRGVVSS